MTNNTININGELKYREQKSPGGDFLTLSVITTTDNYKNT